MVARFAVNEDVAGSNPARGAVVNFRLFGTRFAPRRFAARRRKQANFRVFPTPRAGNILFSGRSKEGSSRLF